jgi:DNA-binding Lrp family transcriptional regulator
MQLNLNKVEAKILLALQENPRITISALSTLLGVSRPTINKTLDELKDSEKILITAGINAKYQKCKLSNIGINVVTPENRSKVVEILRKCPKILNIYRTPNAANLVVTLYGLDEQSITSTMNCIGDLDQVEIKFSNYLGTPLKNVAIPIVKGDNSQTPCGKNCLECMNHKNEWCSGCFTYTE